MSSDGEDRRLVAAPRRNAAADRRRRGKGMRDRGRGRGRRDRSPSYLALRYVVGLGDDDGGRRSPSPARRRARPNRYYDVEEERRSRSRSRSPRRRRERSGEEEDEPNRRSPSPSPSLSPRRRRRRARSNSSSDDEDEPDRRSPSPQRRRRARSNSREEEEEEPDRHEEQDRRSRSPRRILAPRSCRNRSRNRSEECEVRGCCRPGPAVDDDMSEDEDDFYVRIDHFDHLFKCAHCHNLLRPPVVYECVEGHVTCASCHGSANGGEGAAHRCSKCSSTDYAASNAMANWLRSVRFSCRNYDFGCPSFLPRRELELEHERSCQYAPVFCPVRRCDFYGGPRDHLERHLTGRHGWSVDGFRYGEPFRVRVYPAARSVLRAEDGELFHLRGETVRGGTALSMIRIRPDDAPPAEFTYEVKTPAAAGLQHRLQMQSTVLATSLRHRPADVNPVSVTVPDDMFALEGPDNDSVEVCVRKVVAPAGAVAAARNE